MNDTDTMIETGFCVYRKVYSNDEANEIRGAALLALTDSSEVNPYRNGGRLQVRNGFPSLMFWPALISDYLDQIREDERLRDIVSKHLGDNVRQCNNQVYFRCPGDGDGFEWHQDIMFRTGFFGGANDYLQTIVVVDEMWGNGGLRFLSGSHRLGNLNLCTKDTIRRPHPSQVPYDLPSVEVHAAPGDVIVWNAMTAHCSGQNTSIRMRMTYMNGFCKTEASDDWPHYLIDGQGTHLNALDIPYE